MMLFFFEYDEKNVFQMMPSADAVFRRARSVFLFADFPLKNAETS
jgi:hypothetical protein